MSSTFHRMAQSQQPGIGKAVVGSKSEPTPGKVGVKIKAAIFFDGTGNNVNNIKKRLKNPSYMMPKDESDDSRDSYAQYYSNVAILYFMHRKKVPGEKIVSVYMEGIGTSNDGPDDTPGGGFGAGPTGIVARVDRGINDLVIQIKNILKLTDENAYLENLTVCAFGFSRGAAAARHFCARRANARGRASSLCQALGVPASVVTIQFVGLFDTVSSFDATHEKPGEEVGYKAKAVGHALHEDKEFRNDIPELHLNFDNDPQVLNVMHLAAADEYRVNFSSTTIASAVRQGKGFELRLPGAHSDIGGGYAQNLPEVRTYDWDGELKFFLDWGWYAPAQITKDTSFSLEHLYETIYTGTRRVPNTYQYVALSIMLRLAAKAQSGMQFGSPNEDEERGVKYIIEPGHPLFAVKTALEADALARYAGSHTATPPSPQPLPPLTVLPAPVYQKLRREYLHLSWSNRLGFEYRKETWGKPTRLILAG